MRLFHSLSAVLALACAGGAPALAEATGGAVLPGVYAMMQDKSPGEALPEGLAEAALKACKNTPALVYADGLIRALRPNAMDRVDAGGPFFLPFGEMRCAALTGAGVICASRGGENLSEAPPLTVTFTDHGAGIWRLQAVEKQMRLLLAPCEAAMFDITLPNGRNVLAEMIARADGGPALVLPAN